MSATEQQQLRKYWRRQGLLWAGLIGLTGVFLSRIPTTLNQYQQTQHAGVSETLAAYHEKCLAHLHSPDGYVRISAAVGLWSLDDPTGLSVLHQLLQDPDPEVRAGAAQALGNLKQQAAIPVLQPMLQDPDAAVRLAAASTLGKLGNRSGTSTLLALLDNPEKTRHWKSSDIRRWAVRSLGLVGDRSSLPILNTIATQDQDPLIRETAIVAMARLGDPTAQKQLSNFVRLADQSNDATDPILAIAELKDKSAIPVLQDAFKTKPTFVQSTAGYALGQLKDVSAIPMLKEAFSSPDPYVRDAVIAALGEMPVPETRPLLHQALNDADISVRESAALALGRLEDPAAIPVLRHMLMILPEPSTYAGEPEAIDLLQQFEADPSLPKLSSATASWHFWQSLLGLGGTAIAMGILGFLLLRFAQPYPISGAGYLVFPEEVIAELIALKQRRQAQGVSPQQWRLELVFEVARLLWSVQIQMRWDNLWLPPSEQHNIEE
jgi:HEAT repeat protein